MRPLSSLIALALGTLAAPALAAPTTAFAQVGLHYDISVTGLLSHTGFQADFDPPLASQGDASVQSTTVSTASCDALGATACELSFLSTSSAEAENGAALTLFLPGFGPSLLLEFAPGGTAVITLTSISAVAEEVLGDGADPLALAFPIFSPLDLEGFDLSALVSAGDQVSLTFAQGGLFTPMTGFFGAFVVAQQGDILEPPPVPTPEPAALGLLALGVLGIGSARRRRSSVTPALSM